MNFAEFKHLLSNFIREEEDYRNRKIDENWRKPVPVRVREGVAIDELEFAGVEVREKKRKKKKKDKEDEENEQPKYEKYLVFVRRERPENYRFHAGDWIVVSRGNPYNPVFSGIIAHIDEKEDGLFVKVKSTSEPVDNVEKKLQNVVKKLQGDNSKFVIDEDKLNIAGTVQKALSKLDEQIYRVIFKKGQEIPTNMSPDIHRNELELFILLKEKLREHIGFDRNKEKAVQLALASEHFYFIQGPPGTGKTQVLALIALSLAATGKKVAIISFTHNAVNNALKRIQEMLEKIGRIKGTNEDIKKFKGIKVGKIGPEERVEEGLKHLNYDEFMEFYTNNEKIIVGGVIYNFVRAIFDEYLSKDVEKFDVVIFDEVGQMNLAIAFASLVIGKRYVFVGDHKQLGPIIESEVKNELLRKSIIDIIAENYGVLEPEKKENYSIMLTQTYRMNKELCEFPSKYFYEGKLTPAPDVEGRRIKANFSRSPLSDVLDPERPLVLVEFEHEIDAQQNVGEAFVAGFLASEFAKQIGWKRIFVISPFRKQINLISSMIARMREEIGVKKPLPNGVITTIDKAQGRENDVVIVSFVKGRLDENAENGARRFLTDPRRFNVAITRAKSKLVVLMSSNLTEYAEFFKEFYEFCKSKGYVVSGNRVIEKILKSYPTLTNLLLD